MSKGWACAGELQMHCQTAELKQWLERPTYGAPQLAGELPVVHSKCSLLEGAAAATVPQAIAMTHMPEAATASLEVRYSSAFTACNHAPCKHFH